jgi:ADP-heptose:LPS heptosyltransferase
MSAGETVIIYRLGSLGDTVVALPCFHKIAERFPGAERLALTNFPVSSKAPPLESILKSGGLIHGSLAYPIRTRDPSVLWELRRRLRATGARTLVYLGGGRSLSSVYRDLLFFRLCGLTQFFGAPVTRDLNAGRLDPVTGEQEPEAMRLKRCLSALGDIDLSAPEAWNLNLTAEEVQTGEACLAPLGGRPFIAVNTGGKVVEKDWGQANWRTLLSDLAPQIGLPLVFVGGPEDHETAARLSPLWRDAVLDLCGRLTPRETAAALAHAALFIGHDSGPMHLAYAAGVRCVCMFGTINRPRQWYPFGAGHRIFHDLEDVRRVSPVDVHDAVVGVLAESREDGLVLD